MSADEMFHRLAKHHQDLTNKVWQHTNPRLSYEDAAFRINLNHRREAMRVLKCAKGQDGFSNYGVNQNPKSYELHYYFAGGNAQEQLSKCTHDPLFIAIDVGYKLEDLKAVLEEADSLLTVEGIEHFSHIQTAPSFLHMKKPHPPSVLSDEPYIQISISEENLGDARRILSGLIKKYEFLFVVEGQDLDEILVETAK